MTKSEIQHSLERLLPEVGQTLGAPTEIEGEGIFATEPVAGYGVQHIETGAQTILLVGVNDQFGAGLKLERKVLFPRDEAELREFLEACFKSAD